VAGLNLGAGGGTEEVGRIADAGACTTQPPNFASSPVWAAGSASQGAPLCGAEPNLRCCAARALSDRLRSPVGIACHGWPHEGGPTEVAHGASAGQAVRGPPRAGIRPVSGRPAVAAAVPSGVAASEDGGGAGAATAALDTSAGEPRLNLRPGGVSAVPDDVSGAHVVPGTVERRPAGRGGGVPAPRIPKAGVAGPAAPAAAAAAAPLKRPARRRRRYSVEAHRPQTR